MSRIFDALKIAQASRSKTNMQGGNILGLIETPERRESPRVELNVDLTVYGRTAGGPPFYETAKAIRGNANGGLLLVTIPVAEGQDLLLINNQVPKEQLCRVLEFRVRDANTSEVSVAFPEPNAEFWNTAAVAK